MKWAIWRQERDGSHNGFWMGDADHNGGTPFQSLESAQRWIQTYGFSSIEYQIREHRK